MEPQLGWVWLSQTERRAAEAALNEHQSDGARDELGFGVIHFAYADRFFSGTSVLHTSARYIWFVCWAYQELLQRNAGTAFPSKALAQIEDRTGHKLMQHYGRSDGHGIIGGRVLRANRSPITKPSQTYWNALRVWGVLADDVRTHMPLIQSDVQRRWDDFAYHQSTPEVDGIETIHKLFNTVPKCPSDWQDKGAPLSFEMMEPEKDLLRAGWRPKLGSTLPPSLLSRLADRKNPTPDSMYSKAVSNLCDAAEKESLIRAEQAASLVCLGRTLYAAMVNDLKAEEGKPLAEVRKALDDALADHQSLALDLDIAKLKQDVPKLDNGAKNTPSEFIKLLEFIQEWAVTRPVTPL